MLRGPVLPTRTPARGLWADLCTEASGTVARLIIASLLRERSCLLCVIFFFSHGQFSEEVGTDG